MVLAAPLKTTRGKATLALLALAGAYCVMASLAFALPRLIPFQGRITDESNVPFDGPALVTFSIYEQAVAPTAGPTPAAVWNEPHTVNIQNGQVNVILGSKGQSLDALDFATKTYYLGIKVANGPELAPRQELIPSFHARKADLAKAVDNDAIGSSAIKENAITSTNIGDGQVKSVDIGASEVKNANIGDLQISLSKLDDSLQQNISRPLLIVGALDLNATPTLTKTDNALLPVETSGMAIKVIGGNSPAFLTCATGVNPVQADVGGPSKTCAPAHGQLGVAFNIQRAGTYEICIRASFEQIIGIFSADNPDPAGSSQVDSQWNIVETDKNVNIIQEAAVGRELHGLFQSVDGSPTLRQLRDFRTINVCRFLSFSDTSTMKFARLMYIHTFRGVASRNVINMTRPAGFSVKEIR